mmetsp:Transcript_32845/g.96859  ORF Transcript_32845/g.96859 Transcript_32845/m.96859 type:complete len:274 (+) Transcript_32845:550-1371(+)
MSTFVSNEQPSRNPLESRPRREDIQRKRHDHGNRYAHKGPDHHGIVRLLNVVVLQHIVGGVLSKVHIRKGPDEGIEEDADGDRRAGHRRHAVCLAAAAPVVRRPRYVAPASCPGQIGSRSIAATIVPPSASELLVYSAHVHLAREGKHDDGTGEDDVPERRWGPPSHILAGVVIIIFIVHVRPMRDIGIHVGPIRRRIVAATTTTTTTIFTITTNLQPISNRMDHARHDQKCDAANPKHAGEAQTVDPFEQAQGQHDDHPKHCHGPFPRHEGR